MEKNEQRLCLALTGYDKLFATTTKKETPLSQKVKMLEVEKKILERVSKKMFNVLHGFQFVNSISTYDRMCIQAVLNEWMNRYVDAEAEVKEGAE